VEEVVTVGSEVVGTGEESKLWEELFGWFEDLIDASI